MRVKHSTQRIRTLRRRRLALALVTAMAAPMAIAQSLPTAGNVANGGITIGDDGTTMTITQTSKGGIINWGTFNIGTGYGVTFDQQFGSSSVTLNRVTGGSGSSIDGILSANGHVFIVNTSGITFGSGSQVSVGGLVASTLAISDGDFLTGLGNGLYRFSGTGQGTQVRNDGVINAGTGGVALVGPTVFNAGDITATGGNIVAGAGTTVTLDFVGDGLTQVTINGAPTVDSAIVQNRFGTMTADGGKILLRTAATLGGTGGGIYASGFLQARTISNVAGRIELTSDGGPVMVGAPGMFSDANSPYTNGVIDVSGDSGEIGGSVVLSGNGVALVNDYGESYYPYSGEASYIDATGGAGGGNVTITSSGDIYALAGTLIDASSRNAGQGNGGNITLSANGGTAALYGDLQAQGGSTGGNGGLVQVSAQDDIYQYGGSIDVSAIAGNGGQVILSAATGSIHTETLNAYGYVNGGSVVATAATGITVRGDVHAQGELGNGGSISLVASQGPVHVNRTLYAGGYANGGSVTLSGTAVASYYAPSFLYSGDPDAVYVGGSIEASGTNGNGGIVTVDGNGPVVVYYGIYANGGQDGGQVRVSANAGDYPGSIDVGGSVEASGANGNGGIISLVAQQGPVSVNGRVDASGGANGGSITLSGAGVEFYGDGYYYTTDAVYVSGDIDASGYNGNGGRVDISGDGAVVSDGSILANGGVDGGQIRVRANNNGSDAGSIRVDGSIDASGGIGNGGLIDAYSTGNTVVYGDMLAWGGTNGGDISVMGAQVYTGSMLAYGSSGLGGSVSVTADDIVLYGSGTYIDVHGETGGGSIDLHARNNLVLSQNASLSADTGSSGLGGSIHLYAGSSLTAYGALSARGVDGGGSIFTGSGGGINLNGIDVDAGTINGDAGTWTISAPQLTVINGSYQGYISEGYYAGSSSDIQDSDLNNAFATGTSIVLEATNGSVDFNAPRIVAAFPSPLFLHVNATGAITGSGFSIVSDAGALEMLFNADSAGGNANGGYIDFRSASLASNGGLIAMYGQSDQAGGFATGYASGISLAGVDIDSGGGDVVLRGHSTGDDAGSDDAGVYLDASNIYTNGGNIEVHGTGAGGTSGVNARSGSIITYGGDVAITGEGGIYDGIRLFANDIHSDAGDITLIGIGDSVGLAINGGDLTTTSGHIDLRGRGLGANSSGLLIDNKVNIISSGGGIELSGEGGSGAGISLATGSSVDAGNSLVVLRAGNDGSSDAIRLQGAIHGGVGVNLRPGGVDANGGLTERVADGITLGGTTGFALSGAELAMIDSPELIIGSSLHAGAIQVLGAVSRGGNMTLQNNGGPGGIDIQAALNVGGGTLALSSGGSITQTGAGAITAHSLLAKAGADVRLAAAQNNVAETTLAGSAGGVFQFQDVDALAIGNVTATGMDASSNSLSTLGANGIGAGGDVFVRNLAGDLILNANVTGANIDLVTATRLQNLAGASLIASGNWRVWANTWVGETRGGLGGSGNLPNLYGCTFQGGCGVTVPGSGNHFIYVQQPTAVVSLDSFSREYGLANPLLTFSVTGAILGDMAANVASGTATTTATIGSNVGNYPINGAFTSAAGYRIQVVPGTLGITPATLFFTADAALRFLGMQNPPFSGTVTGFRNGDSVQSVFGTDTIWTSQAGLLSPVGFYAVNGGTSAKNYVLVQAPGNATALHVIPLPQLPGTPTQIIRETVDTYVYDRNFGSVPMCALNASLDDQKLASKGDELSTEWSKVRSRPNLTSCFESERRNSCGDF